MSVAPETELERRLRDHAADGTELDLADLGERHIATAALRALLVDGEHPIHALGVRVRKAVFDGPLNLSYAEVRAPVILRDCEFSDDLILRNARVGTFSVTDSELHSVRVAEAHVDGDLNLSRSTLNGDLDATLAEITGHVLLGASCVKGVTRLGGAQIGGKLDGSGGDFHRPVEATTMHVGERVALSSAADGTRCKLRRGLVMARTEIGHDIDLRGGRFQSIDAVGAKVAHNVDLRPDRTGRPCSCAGKLEVSFAKIGGSLDCSDARLWGEMIAVDLDVSGNAVVRPRTVAGAVQLGGSRIDGSLEFGGGFVAGVTANRITVGNNVDLSAIETRREVVLTLADIGGDLDCTGGRFDKGVTANRMKVGGSVKFEAADSKGPLALTGTSIGGDLRCHDTTFDGPEAGLYADGTTVDLTLVWRPQRGGSLSLRHAHVGTLADTEAAWPQKGKLKIDHFVYDGFGAGAPVTPSERIRWLRRQDPFHAEPYERLARLYRAQGHDAHAREVGIARERERRRRGKPGPFGWLWSMILACTIRYGYRPAFALAWLAGIYVIGACIFVWAGDRGGFQAVRARPATATAAPAPASDRCERTDAYPCFNAYAYSVDVVVPLLNLRQAESWQPDATKYAGRVARLYGWIATPLGWLFTTLGVAAFTGLIRKE